MRDRCSREEANRYLVVTDGRITETSYFERLNRLSKDVIIVESVKHFKDLVRVALRMMSNGNYDSVFIVCDIDEHCKNANNRVSFEELLGEARKKHIIPLCSHESFEVWLLCHKMLVTAEARDRKNAQRMAEDLGLLRGKNAKLIADETVTVETIALASEEAKRLRRVYGDNVLDDGPTTDVDGLIDLLKF